MSKKYTIKLDFQRDFINILKNKLKNLGYEIDDKEDPRNICIRYFNLKRRLIKPIPRKILISKEFNCPIKYNSALEIIKSKIKKGEDLKSYLSKGISNIDYNDSLLNDWGIHHLHLGMILGKGGFIKRTGAVLLVRFDKNYAYFIDVRRHDCWSDQELIHIIHRNWPESIKIFRLRGVISLQTILSDEQIGKLRKAGYNNLVQISEGIVYYSMGMGQTTNGTSLEVVRTCHKYFYLMRNLEKHIKDNIEYFISEAKKQGISMGNELNFELVINKSEAFAIEKHSKIIIKLGNI